MANRIGRLELLFWWIVSNLAGGVVLAVYSALRNKPIESFHYPLDLPSALTLIAVVLVVLRGFVSRFHDLGWPTWVAVGVMFVPLLNVVAILVALLVPGQKHANRYGEPPVFLQRLRKSAHNLR